MKESINTLPPALAGKYEHLQQILKDMGSVAVAFSSGVDSTFLLKAARLVLGEEAVAVTAHADWFARSEWEEAQTFCREEGIPQIILPVYMEEIEHFTENPPDRCYYCKKVIFSSVCRYAKEHHLAWVADGSNTDDDGDYRPGMRAIAELGIRSPLKEAGLSKAEIRQLSKMLDLPTWNKPSAACLASRFVYHETITPEKLRMVDQAEDVLRSLGLKQLRVRIHGEDLARIEVLPEDLPRLMEHREELTSALKNAGFRYVTLDLQGYRTGSMNEVLAKA